jgi:tripartite-type tricarboxylate transporter receptor subunit TctC
LLSWVVRKPEWLKSGKIRILAQVGIRKFAGFENVPILTEFARTDDEKQILGLISSRAAIGRPFVAPPGVPASRVAALRRAFVATMKDPEFQADVKSRKLLNMWSTGEEVEAVVKRMLATPKPLIEKTRKVLGYAS